MDLLIGALLIVMLALYWASRRQREEQPPFQKRTGDRAQPDGKKLIGIDGAKCIYSDNQVTISIRVNEVKIEADLVQFRAQPLRTLGLSDVPEDTFSFCAPYDQLERGSGCLIARNGNWQLHMDPQLIETVTVLARNGENELAIKKLLHQYGSRVPA